MKVRACQAPSLVLQLQPKPCKKNLQLLFLLVALLLLLFFLFFHECSGGLVD